LEFSFTYGKCTRKRWTSALFSGFYLSSVVFAANKQQSRIQAISGHASINNMATSPIPIPMVLTLTQQSTMLHNGKVWP
jgi:hypothetical protein